MPRLFPILLIAVSAAVCNQSDGNTKVTDYQKMAQDTPWQSPDEWKGEGLVRSLTSGGLNDYQLEVIRRKGSSWEVRIRIVDDGKEVYAWDGHFGTTFFYQRGVLYYVDFHHECTGCAVVAFDLKERKPLWRTDLKGIGPVSHSKWTNFVRLERVNDEVLAVYGKDGGTRYVEIVDLKTGKTVGHKLFADNKEMEQLVTKLGTLKVKGPGRGGPYVGIGHNEVTNEVVKEGKPIVPFLIARLDESTYDETVYLVFCLRELKAIEARDKVNEVRKALKLKASNRFGEHDLTLEMQIEFYLKDVISWK